MRRLNVSTVSELKYKRRLNRAFYQGASSITAISPGYFSIKRRSFIADRFAFQKDWLNVSADIRYATMKVYVKNHRLLKPLQ